MPINKVEFVKLERNISKTGSSFLDHLAPEFGKAYVVAITRDGCPACEKQKPKLDELATSLEKKHGKEVAFTRIHVRYSPDSQEESLRSKGLLGHYFYPTNMILLRTADRGTIEYYKNSSPSMGELKKNIAVAAKIAAMIKKEKT